MAAVYPLGRFTLLVPISYVGFGVGHVAFERLFSLRRSAAQAGNAAKREPEPSSTRLAPVKS